MPICSRAHPFSDLNTLLAPTVVVCARESTSADIYIHHGALDLVRLKNLQKSGTVVIVSAHGQNQTIEDTARRLSGIGRIHLVSEVQLNCHEIPLENCFVIPNWSQPYANDTPTGTVGRVRNPAKDATAALAIERGSQARRGHRVGRFAVNTHG